MRGWHALLPLVLGCVVAFRTRSRRPAAGVPSFDPRRLGSLDRAFVRALAIALVLHLPFVPSRLVDWAQFFFTDASDYDDPDAQAIIPVDLDILSKEPVVEPPASPAPAPPPAPGPVEPKHAPAPPRPPPRPAPSSDAAAGAGDAGAPAPVKDPLAAAGGAGKVAAKDPNVQLLFSGAVLRKHELGPWFSRVLLMLPEWQQFFQATQIDPIRDIDHLLITAPRLRGDASKLVAVMDLRAPHEQVREAVDQVVHRAGGVWIEDAPVPTARARVLGAPRLFALIPEKRLLMVLPGDAVDQLGKLRKTKSFRSSAEGLVVSLVTPARPLRGFFPLPDSLKWLRLAIIPTADGGIDLAIEAGDQSWQDAERHAEAMTADLERMRKVDVLGLTTVEILDPVTFVSSGDTIRARTHVSRSKLGRITAYIEQQAQARVGAQPPSPSSHP